MSAAPDERAAFFEALRRSSAKLLKLDPDALSAAESVRVDRCAALRLMLDQMQSAQLAGATIDAKGYISASAELERLLGGQPEAPTHVFASDESRRRLKAMIERTLGDVSDGDAAAADAMAREEAVQALAAAPVDAAQAAPPPQPQLQQPTNNNVVPIAVNAITIVLMAVILSAGEDQQQRERRQQRDLDMKR
jgi:hypothetical protein